LAVIGNVSAAALSCYILTSNLPEKNLKATVDPENGDFELKSSTKGTYLSVDSLAVKHGSVIWQRNDCKLTQASYDPDESNFRVTCQNSSGYLNSYYRINKAISSGTAYALFDGVKIFEAKLEYCR
jgi:hypothetical protein